MSSPTDPLNLDVDLAGGVVPISKAASALAARIKRSRERRQPIIITQKGYPTGVILPIDLFVALRERAERPPGARRRHRPPRSHPRRRQPSRAHQSRKPSSPGRSAGPTARQRRAQSQITA